MTKHKEISNVLSPYHDKTLHKLSQLNFLNFSLVMIYKQVVSHVRVHKGIQTLENNKTLALCARF